MRENACEKVTIGFAFTSHLLRKWQELFQPIKEKSADPIFIISILNCIECDLNASHKLGLSSKLLLVRKCAWKGPFFVWKLLDVKKKKKKKTYDVEIYVLSKLQSLSSVSLFIARWYHQVGSIGAEEDFFLQRASQLRCSIARRVLEYIHVIRRNTPI